MISFPQPPEIKDDLRLKVQRSREETAQLLRHNHQLLNQLEEVAIKQHSLQSENEALRKCVGEKDEQLDEMQAMVDASQRDRDSSDKAVR